MEKNIMFLYTRDMDINDSGGARTTIMLINYLASHGYICHCLFNIVDGHSNNIVYHKRKGNYETQIKSIVNKYDIKVILVPEAIMLTDYAYKAINGLDCKIISALHNKPGYERIRLYVLLFESFLLNDNIIKRFRSLGLLLLYPIFYMTYCLWHYFKFRSVYKKSDYMVLLSETFIPEFSKVYNVDTQKLKAIGNPVSFDTYADESILNNKEKTLLIVSRFEERSKRIILSLRIWKDIQDKFPNWKLEIVGFGRSLPIYEWYIRKNNLKRVYLRGKQDPLEYYRKASIFMMTSAYEGWGMTIVEAMQMGCVPVVMDSFSSLHTIVDDGINGFTPRYCDVKEYESKLSMLMKNREQMKSMGLSAVKKSRTWEPDNVCSKYMRFIDTLF